LEVFDGVHIYNELNLERHQEITLWIADQNLILPKTIKSFNDQSRKGYIICGDKLTVGTVSPGYDDRKIRPEGTYLDRKGVETYRRYWDNLRGLELDWVIITSWNEWQEGTEIEPSLENGYTALIETMRQIESFMEG